MAFWTHYGRWDDDGLRVIGAWGQVVYRLSDAAEAKLPQSHQRSSGQTHQQVDQKQHRDHRDDYLGNLVEGLRNASEPDQPPK